MNQLKKQRSCRFELHSAESDGIASSMGGALVAPVATQVAEGAAGATWANVARRVAAFWRSAEWLRPR